MDNRTITNETKSKLSNTEMFIQFYYPEVKDLSKSFLTLVSGILAFSITFSTSIIGVSTASKLQLILLISAWLFFIIAIIAAGSGLYNNFVAANIANKAILNDTELKFRQLLKRPYMLLNIAGVSFVIGLILLALAGATKFL
jgi:hypothetical protein